MSSNTDKSRNYNYALHEEYTRFLYILSILYICMVYSTPEHNLNSYYRHFTSAGAGK